MRTNAPRIRSALALCAVAIAAWSTPASSLPVLSDVLTDAATRLARDLRDGAARLGSSAADRVVVTHRIKARPEGCRHGYRVQLSAASTLVVWCRTADGAATAGSYSTTSHLPAVTVPRTWIVDKAAGEPLRVELTRAAGKPVVSRVD